MTKQTTTKTKTIADYCCVTAVESNVCRVAVCRQHGYRVFLKLGHTGQELPKEFERIEASMRRARMVDMALFAAMNQMAAIVHQ